MGCSAVSGGAGWAERTSRSRVLTVIARSRAAATKQSRASRNFCSGLLRFARNDALVSHVVVVRVVQDVEGEQGDGLVAEVLPPMGGALGLGTYLARLVQDRDRAVAGVFDDLALDDVDQRGTISMAVPRHDAAGLDHQLANPLQMIVELHRLLRQVDAGQHG